jgi:hypothetical protein
MGDEQHFVTRNSLTVNLRPAVEADATSLLAGGFGQRRAAEGKFLLRSRFDHSDRCALAMSKPSRSMLDTASSRRSSAASSSRRGRRATRIS